MLSPINLPGKIHLGNYTI